MAREDLHFRLRIPEELKQRIQHAADAHKRSMTAEIISRLEWTFAEGVDGGSEKYPSGMLTTEGLVLMQDFADQTARNLRELKEATENLRVQALQLIDERERAARIKKVGRPRGKGAPT